MDKFGFKILMFIICFFELGVSSTIYYFSDNPYVFVIENIWTKWDFHRIS